MDLNKAMVTDDDGTLIVEMRNMEKIRALRVFKFLTKSEMLCMLKHWDSASKYDRTMRITEVLCPDGLPTHKRVRQFHYPEDIDRIASLLMELSLTHGILWIENDFLFSNPEVWVAETEHYTTNIDADVIDGIIGKLKEISENGIMD